MEKVNEKAVPPPSYTAGDSDVESIIKPEAHDIEQKGTKPLPTWQNNVFLRSNRRRLVCAGVLSTIVVLAIILGAVGSQGLLKKSKQQSSDGHCLQWLPNPTPTLRSDDYTTEYVYNAYCAVWVGGSPAYGSTAVSSTSNPLQTGHQSGPLELFCVGWEIVSVPNSGQVATETSGQAAGETARCIGYDARPLGDSSYNTATVFGNTLGDSAFIATATAAPSFETSFVAVTTVAPSSS